MKLNRMIDPRKAYGPNEAPPELVALIFPELERLIEEGSKPRKKTKRLS